MTRMKESSIDWIGQIPEEWEIVKFKYLFNTSKGLSITKEYLVDEGIPVINYGQIHSSLTKQVQSCDDRLPFVANYYLSKKGVKLNQGDFVFADTSEDLEGAGNFSTRLDSTGQLLAGYHTIIARLNDYDEHDFRYFMHLFDSLAIRKQIQNKVSGVKVYSVTQGILNSIFVIIPPKNEQQKIADFLDKKTAQLDKVKALLDEQIQKLKDYRASLIYETVTKGLDKTVPLKDSGIDWIGQVPQGWGVKAIKYIFDEIGSGSTPKSDNEIFYDGDINWIQSGDLYQTDTVTSVSKTISYQGFKSTSALKIYQPPFVALAMYGASVGNVAVSYIDACVNQAVVVMLGASEKVRFGKYAIEASKSNLIFSAQGGTQPNISQNLIKNWSIPQPKNEEQVQIVDFLDKKTVQIDKLIQIKNQQIDNINKQRQTLIYEYVTGKRRV